jgi:MoaA/NifB/PqqE/SkfB family radical SAM enzyme
MSLYHLQNLTGDHLHTLPILILYLTDGCNSRCAMCDIWRSPRRNMPAALIDSLVEEVRSLKIRWVVFSGGEATQHPDWANIARRFRAAGARVILLTNGLFLRKQTQDVIDSIDEVVVSLDGGTAATYDSIRGVDAFDLVLEGIQAVRNGGVSVTARTTIQRANFREMPLIIDAAKRAGANLISFLTIDVSNPYAFGPRFADGMAIPVINEHEPPASALTAQDTRELAAILDDVERAYAADFANGLIAETPAKLRRMIGYFDNLRGEADYAPPRCNAPHISAVIEVDGDIRPCYFLPATGKLKQRADSEMERGSPLKHALNSSEALALRHAYRTGQRAECARCVCPLHKGARSLLAF